MSGCLLALAGCATGPGKAVSPVVKPLVPIASPARPAEAFIDVTSEPAAAYILLNDQLAGRTPQRVAVEVTPRGFCADYLTIKVRFVARDPSEISQTVEADLTPREKAPQALAFTPQGVERHLR